VGWSPSLQSRLLGWPPRGRIFWPNSHAGEERRPDHAGQAPQAKVVDGRAGRTGGQQRGVRLRVRKPKEGSFVRAAADGRTDGRTCRQTIEAVSSNSKRRQREGKNCGGGGSRGRRKEGGVRTRATICLSATSLLDKKPDSHHGADCPSTDRPAVAVLPPCPGTIDH
jgi:hypothetical protein